MLSTVLHRVCYVPLRHKSYRLYSSQHHVTESEDTQLTAGELALGNKLKEKFNGASIQVADISGGCGTFYAVSIQHPSFKGIPIVKQHRMVQDVLREEIGDMHGIQLKTSAP